MRSTLTYAFMTLSLGSVLGYAVWSAEQPMAFTPVAFEAPIVVTKDQTIPSNKTSQGAVKTINAGATRQEVIALLGEPPLIDSQDDRWTYGSHVIMFKNDRVAGMLKIDPHQEMREAFASLNDDFDAEMQPQTPTTGRNSSSTRRGTSAHHGKSYARSTGRINPASARGYYRSPSKQYDDYSYYMSNAGPMNRLYFRKPSLPRGMLDYRGQQNYGRGREAYVIQPDGRRVNRNGSYLWRNRSQDRYDRR